MKQSAHIKALLTSACIYYSILSIAMILFYLLNGVAGNAGNLPQFLFFFPCGLFLSGAGLLRKSRLFSAAVRQILHYAIIILAFFLFLWLPSGKHSASVSFTMFALLTVGYWVLFLLIRLGIKRFHSFREE